MMMVEVQHEARARNGTAAAAVRSGIGFSLLQNFVAEPLLWATHAGQPRAACLGVLQLKNPIDFSNLARPWQQARLLAGLDCASLVK
jgi:hypothetical protein